MKEGKSKKERRVVTEGKNKEKARENAEGMK